MVEGILIDILKSGSIAFIGSKITKAIQQKEISELIEGAGWCIVGVDIVKLIIPLIKGMEALGDKIANMFNACDRLVNSLKGIDIIGKFIEKGMVH